MVYASSPGYIRKSVSTDFRQEIPTAVTVWATVGFDVWKSTFLIIEEGVKENSSLPATVERCADILEVSHIWKSLYVFTQNGIPTDSQFDSKLGQETLQWMVFMSVLLTSGHDINPVDCDVTHIGERCVMYLILKRVRPDRSSYDVK